MLEEADTDRSLLLYDTVPAAGGSFVAPPHVFAEVSSAIYKRARRGELELDAALRLTDEAQVLSLATISPPSLHRRALQIAAEFRMRWIYDAFYVALAEIVGCDLWTADAALHESVRATHKNVHLLSDYPLG